MADEAIARLRHDLASPLTALLTEAQLLLLDEASLDPDVVRGLRQIESLARVLRDMLAASRAADRPGDSK
jgi:signal transduction histidine kinase